MRRDQLSNTLQNRGNGAYEVGLLCMTRKACRTPDADFYGEVYTEVLYDGSRRELLFGNWWEAEFYARARRLLAVHACGFLPPVEQTVPTAMLNMWDLMQTHADPDGDYAGHDWHKRYLKTLDDEARERGDVEHGSLFDDLSEET